MRHCPNPECPETALLGSAAEYRDEIVRCPVCGADLIGHSGDAQQTNQDQPPPSMVCVASYRDLAPACMARAALESQGFSVVLHDEHTVAVNWLYSQAIGGVKLMVFDTPRADALEALCPVGPEIFAELPEMHLPPTSAEICPECGAADVGHFSLVPRYKALSLLFFAFAFMVPFAAHRQFYYCRSCDHRWKTG
jgi:hypothetical protein